MKLKGRDFTGKKKKNKSETTTTLYARKCGDTMNWNWIVVFVCDRKTRIPAFYKYSIVVRSWGREREREWKKNLQKQERKWTISFSFRKTNINPMQWRGKNASFFTLTSLHLRHSMRIWLPFSKYFMLLPSSKLLFHYYYSHNNWEYGTEILYLIGPVYNYFFKLFLVIIAWFMLEMIFLI